MIVPYTYLSREYDIHALWYNPNIQPLTEYMERMNAVKVFQEYSGAKVIYQTDYQLEEFFREIVFRESSRCKFCYHKRLEKAANIAKKGKFNYFSTTLLQSHQQDRELIIDIGKQLENRYKVKFLIFDFRDKWKEGVELSKKLGMYRQQYCGCIYSEYDRYKFRFQKLKEKFKEKK